MSRPAIHPVSWDPPRPVGGPPPANLPRLNVLPVPGTGPEDVLYVGDDLLTGLDDGRIIRISPDGWRIDVVADTGGRPMGLESHPDGSVVVCDEVKGLLRVEPRTGRVYTLVARGEHRLHFCNNAAVAPDGTVYFSDSTQNFDLEHYTADLLEHSGTGRLLRRTPDGGVDVMADGLQFANGVALAEDFVAVAQTGQYCVDRVSLSDGSIEPLVTNLPAFPDNLSTGDDGLIWVAMASARKALLDGLPARRPWLRKAIWALPEALQPKPDLFIWVRAYRPDGALVRDYYGGDERFGMVTGVRVAGGRVALGSLQSTSVSWFPIT
jgi:hypothetical protein